MKKSKESLRKKVDVFVMTRIGRLLVNRGERPKGPKVVIIIILSITGVVRSIKNRKQIIAKYWDVSDLRQLKDCQFGLNLFWGNGTSWETNGKMYLFAFFGVDLKFAVSIWAYFPLNHHSIQQTALHTPQTLVRNLQDYLIFSSSLALIFDQLELSCQTQLHGSKLKKWTEANLINWVYITTNHILLMLKGIVETKKENLMLWHFLHKASMHLKARPRKHFILWDFCCDTSLCWRPQKICLFSSFLRDFVQYKIKVKKLQGWHLGKLPSDEEVLTVIDCWDVGEATFPFVKNLFKEFLNIFLKFEFYLKMIWGSDLSEV